MITLYELNKNDKTHKSAAKVERHFLRVGGHRYTSVEAGLRVNVIAQLIQLGLIAPGEYLW